VKGWLNHGEMARRIVEEADGSLSEGEKLARLIEENVVAQLENIRTHPPVALRLARAEIALHGWIYNIGEGKVTATAARPHLTEVVPVLHGAIERARNSVRVQTREYARGRRSSARTLTTRLPPCRRGAGNRSAADARIAGSVFQNVGAQAGTFCRSKHAECLPILFPPRQQQPPTPDRLS
jgi:hypothetical protein